jgi:hypothetical protein
MEKEHHLDRDLTHTIYVLRGYYHLSLVINIITLTAAKLIYPTAMYHPESVLNAHLSCSILG